MKARYLLHIVPIVVVALCLIPLLKSKRNFVREIENKTLAKGELLKLTECAKLKRKADSLNFTQEWRQLKCGLWENKEGEIAIRTSRVVCSETQILAERYISELWINDTTLSIKNVVDTSSFKNIGSSYYKDKNNIYQHDIMASGGNFYVLENVDYDTFKVLNDCYAKDKSHIFELRKGVLDGVDYKSFTTKMGLNVCIAKDKSGYIMDGERVKQSDLNVEYIKNAIEEFGRK